jgi:hypothetical protein
VSRCKTTAVTSRVMCRACSQRTSLLLVTRAVFDSYGRGSTFYQPSPSVSDTLSHLMSSYVMPVQHRFVGDARQLTDASPLAKLCSMRHVLVAIVSSWYLTTSLSTLRPALQSCFRHRMLEPGSDIAERAHGAPMTSRHLSPLSPVIGLRTNQTPGSPIARSSPIRSFDHLPGP